MRKVFTKKGTLMARCELGGRAATSAVTRLAPFLLVKRTQALLFLEISRTRPRRRGRTPPSERAHDRLEAMTRALHALQGGLWDDSAELPLSEDLRTYRHLSVEQLGWTREETLAYLAGIMDSDGNLRIEKKRVQKMLWPHYRINIRCAQVSPSPAIDLLASTFGGRTAAKKPTRRGCRELVSWSLHDRSAAPAIVALLPHLRVKWTQACLLLELRNLKSRGKMRLTEWTHQTRWRRPATMRKRSYSSGQVADFERIFRTVQALHASEAVKALSGP